MVKLVLSYSLLILSLGLSAQAGQTAQQIKWTVVAKKTGANSAEIYFKATLAPPGIYGRKTLETICSYHLHLPSKIKI